MVAAAFSYLKGAHDNKDDSGNWNWNPSSWDEVPALAVSANGNFDQQGMNINMQPTLTPTGTHTSLPIGPTVDWDVDFGNPLDRDSGGDNQNLENALMRHSEQAVSLQEWTDANQGLTRSQIINQRHDRSLGLRSQPGGPNLRYVFDPLNPNAIIDMRHMLIVGKYGNLIGNTIEGFQWSNGQASGMDPQDFYSNRLGYRFYNYVEGRGATGWLINNIISSPTDFINRLNLFLTSHDFRGNLLINR